MRRVFGTTQAGRGGAKETKKSREEAEQQEIDSFVKELESQITELAAKTKTLDPRSHEYRRNRKELETLLEQKMSFDGIASTVRKATALSMTQKALKIGTVKLENTLRTVKAEQKRIGGNIERFQNARDEIEDMQNDMEEMNEELRPHYDDDELESFANGGAQGDGQVRSELALLLGEQDGSFVQLPAPPQSGEASEEGSEIHKLLFKALSALSSSSS
jgi:chromosome segregation ATPase